MVLLAERRIRTEEEGERVEDVSDDQLESESVDTEAAADPGKETVDSSDE